MLEAWDIPHDDDDVILGGDLLLAWADLAFMMMIEHL
jgi:hypothetical protein